MMGRNILPTAVLLGGLAIQIGQHLAHGQSPYASSTALGAVKPTAADPTLPMPGKVPEPPTLSPPKPEETDRALPINLATALKLADARPLVIEAARAAVETEYGLYEQARVLWLPNVYVGVDAQRHDGGQQNVQNGQAILGARNQFLAGAGARAVFALTDAIYAPLAERQLLRSRNIDVQTAQNDALLSVAVSYFDVQQARGVLAGTRDSVTRARELARRVSSLGKGLAAPIEIERVNTLLADLLFSQFKQQNYVRPRSWSRWSRLTCWSR